jgi:RNA polymerase sigma-70 factor (ECF subfamily)
MTLVPAEWTREQRDDAARRALLDELVRLATGEQRDEWFPNLFREYYPRVLGFLRSRTASTSEAEDLTQETFLRAHRKLVPFFEVDPFEAWLFEIAHNLARNSWRDRHAAKRSGQEEPLELLDRVPVALALLARPGGPVPRDPLLSCLDQERLALLSRELNSLPGQMKRCAVLRFHHELKYREISELTGIAVDTVKAHLYQARKRLQAALGPYFDVPEEEDDV